MKLLKVGGVIHIVNKLMRFSFSGESLTINFQPSNIATLDFYTYHCADISSLENLLIQFLSENELGDYYEGGLNSPHYTRTFLNLDEQIARINEEASNE